MVSVTLLAVGKLKEKHYIQACEEYLKRLRAFATVTVTELPERPADTPAEIAKGLALEAELIEKAIPKGAFFIVMTPEGNMVSSEGLAEKLQAINVGGDSRICLLIGGSNGIDERIKQRADWKLSMSKMTFPHHLARVMVLEQVYRAFSILNHSRYHK
ncbi:MAG: 23S rRNA (pseudouridine(1915)-N(3))-methyltransferase RlmH [Clostridia bacterium]|nr:23S rRNA (pseudouridine(1915)-N(3))-methyltransferase RlmH [Clostridia bacterium]